MSGLFDKLVEVEQDKWNRIIPFLRGKDVILKYSDRYLSTPLGCLLLAHFISNLKQRLAINIKAISIMVKVIHNNFDSCDTNINGDFISNSARNNFLKNAIDKLVNITPIINDRGYIEHERCLTVKSLDTELCIRPDAGIAHGWTPFGNKYQNCSDRDIKDNWDMDIRLYNKKQKFSGILYTISFNKQE